MTTIAVNKREIAGDLQLTHTNGIVFKGGTKLFEFENKEIYKHKFAVGFCGDVDTAYAVMKFFVDPANYKAPKKHKDVEFVLLTADHKMFTFSNPGLWIPVQDKYYAIGSGSHFAMGAMACGKTPTEAVKVAIQLDKGSGFGVDTIEL